MALMAATKARVEINRRALSDLQLQLADGLANVAEAIAQAASARAPDQFEDDKGLPDRWGWAIYVAGKKVRDGSGDGTAVRPPRELQVSRADGLTGFVGFGFPGRFQEFGTVHHGAQPFLTPAVDSVTPQAPALIRSAVRS